MRDRCAQSSSYDDRDCPEWNSRLGRCNIGPAHHNVRPDITMECYIDDEDPNEWPKCKCGAAALYVIERHEVKTISMYEPDGTEKELSETVGDSEFEDLCEKCYRERIEGLE